MNASAAALLLLAAATSAPPPEGEPGPRWHEGPVRYLLSAGEEREARSLGTAQERAGFVELFWRRRDPTPGTPANEFRDEFRRRVESADRLFAETTKPGWKTDRGKIYILLGPPDETSAAPMEAGRRGVAAWIYRNTPQPDIGPQVVVRFAQDSSGEYRLTADAFADSQVVRPAAAGIFPQPLPGPPFSDVQSDLAGRTLYGRLQDVPVTQPVPHVSVAWSAHGNPFRSCASYYLSEDGSTLAVVTFEVDPAFLQEDPEYRPRGLRALGHLAGIDGRERIDLGTLSALEPQPAPPSRSPLRFQALRALRPGRYRAYLALVDERERLRGSYHEDLAVPALPADRLALSTLTLAEGLAEAGPPGSAPRLEPFVLGHLRVVPRCSAVFAAEEELGLYYQIYDGRRPSGGEPPPLGIEYRLELLLEGERYALGPPLRVEGQRSRVQGQTFRLAGWPAGAYLLSLVVSDPSDGARAVRQVAFEIR